MDQILDKLKESALKAKEGAGKLAKVFAKRTSDAVAGTKLSFSINEANNKIRDIYAKIGKDIYNMYLEGEIDNSSFESEFEQIEKLMADIESLSEKKAELKSALYCAKCGAMCQQGSEYCSKCGAELTNADEEACEVIEEDSEEITITPQKAE